MKKEIRILVATGAVEFFAEVERELHRAHISHRAQQVESSEAFLEELQRRCPDVVLATHAPSTFDSAAAFSIAAEKRPDVPFIFVTTSAEQQPAGEQSGTGSASAALKSSLTKLAPTVRRALREANKRSKLREAELRVLTARWFATPSTHDQSAPSWDPGI